MIEELRQLKTHLEANPTRGRAYEILLFMVSSYLDRPDFRGKLTFEASTLLESCGTAAERISEPKDWVPNIKVLQKALALAQPREGPCLKMGYQPGGGRGVVSLYWLEPVPQNEAIVGGEPETQGVVNYRRSAPGAIKPSLVARLFLHEGMMLNLSVRGVTLLSTILLGSVLWTAMLGLALVSLAVSEEPVTMREIILLAISVLGFLFVWKEIYAPWFRVVDDCVVKAPLWLTSFGDDGCELEMFRNERRRWTRLVQFSADCPLCGSTIKLQPGRPDHKYPLVGRCVESPHVHVYSFDRMTLKGVYLGPASFPQGTR